jgi:predicted transcriptional regulator
MSTLSLRLPESLHRRLAEVAERDGVSINQLISSAVAEKMSALLTQKYLEARAKRATGAKFSAALAKVPSLEPDAFDRLDVRAPRRVAQPTVAATAPGPRRRRTRARTPPPKAFGLRRDDRR